MHPERSRRKDLPPRQSACEAGSRAEEADTKEGVDSTGPGRDFVRLSTAAIAQLVRAQDCDSWGRGFESRWPPHFTRGKSRDTGCRVVRREISGSAPERSRDDGASSDGDKAEDQRAKRIEHRSKFMPAPGQHQGLE